MNNFNAHTGDGLCGCDWQDQLTLANYPNGAIGTNGYQCSDQDCLTSSAGPEQCDGVRADNTPPFDAGCGKDEQGCSGLPSDGDDAPLRFSSGRVETNPLTLFSLPTPDGIFFGYRIQWGSHIERYAAMARYVNNQQEFVPTIHDQREVTHFFGDKWFDNYSDRLFINVLNKAGDTTLASQTITWQHEEGTVTFTAANGWKSWSNKFELIDRCNGSPCSPSDGLGRWVVRTTDTNAPRAVWSFEELTYTGYQTPNPLSLTIGRLRRHALTNSDYTNLKDAGHGGNAQYGWTVTWNTNGLITSVIDDMSRELDFVYTSTANPLNTSITTRYVLSTVQYKPGSGSASPVVALQMDPSNTYLERVQRVGVAGYTRYLYNSSSSLCSHCGDLLTDVIVPGDAAGTTPAQGAPPLSTEVVLEHDDYGAGETLDSFRATHTKSVGREFQYEWPFITQSDQFDLHQDGGACGNCACSCAPGYACSTTFQHCYVANIMIHDQGTRLPTGRSSGNEGTGSEGSVAAFSRNYTSTGAPHDSLDAAGTQHTYGYDTTGRIRCVVHGDSDTEAFTDPANPNASTCAGPSTGQIVQVDYGTNAITKTTASLLSGNVIEVKTLDSTYMRPISVAVTGETKDITGTLHSETHTSTIAYDTYGRLVTNDGPLDNSVAYDVTTMSYYTSADGSYNYGNVSQVTHYVGTVSSYTALTTIYSQYDVFGVPGKIQGPNGDYVTLSPSSNRLTWTIVQKGSDGTTIGTSTIVFNANGTLRSITDPDGICLTYDYFDSANGVYVGAPTRIRRSTSTDHCGDLSFSNSSGEVELRTYTNDEVDRLASVTRQMSGTVAFSYSGFSYDRDRRLTAATTPDSASPYTMEYSDVLLTGVIAPGAPAAGSWRTDTTVDALARPASLLRYIDASNKQTYNYAYASPFSPRPTQLTRGYNGASTSVTTFTYDDFGRLLDTTVPEAGTPGSPATTRYEYDVGGRIVKKRVGSGTAGVRTDVYSYDSLDRVTSVDHDTEHPVSCSTAPQGTPIEDEEYRYDSCTGDVPSAFSCTNALGRLTISRAILQCGSSQQVVKRGRWYTYDVAGRLSQVAYATVTGATIGTPAIMIYAYTPAGRLLSYSSPLNASWGTSYSYWNNSGLISSVGVQGNNTNIATPVQYKPFGPVYSIIGNAGNYNMQLSASYTSANYALSNETWQLFGGGSIYLLNQTLQRTPAGAISTRNDSADNASYKYYAYDSLMRLTCEARGGNSPVHTPSSSDCVTSSSWLAGLFTYGDGQNSTTPPDVRTTSFLRSGDNSFVSPSVETSTYSSGSTQVQGVTRTGSSLTISYDALGRRSYDYDSFDATRSRRDYTYLPNGQVGSVSGQNSSGQSYTVSMLYDEKGRPLNIVDSVQSFPPYQDMYDLYWDDANRLISAQITFGQTRGCPAPPGGNCTGVRWHYHYLGNRVIAMTREMIGNGNVIRFMAATDERGLIYRLVDSQQGLTSWQAIWDASGWRTWVGTPQPEMWVPFGLPGQIILGKTQINQNGLSTTVWGTEAYASGSGGTWTRPPIALNLWRAYDPYFGGFLQPDRADQTSRLDPEGYMYGRMDPLIADAAGDRSLAPWEFDFVGTLNDCPDSVANAISEAALEIATCVHGACAGRGGDNLTRQWLQRLATMNLHCPTSDGKYFTIRQGYNDFGTENGPSSAFTMQDKNDAGIPWGYDVKTTDPSQWQTFISPLELSDDQQTKKDQHYSLCLANLVAHESLHSTIKNIQVSAMFGGTPTEGLTNSNAFVSIFYGPAQTPQDIRDGADREEQWVDRTTDDCIDCGSPFPQSLFR